MTYRSASTRAAAFDQALREAMSAPVSYGCDPFGTWRAGVAAAGARRAERNPADAVAPVTAILDSDSDARDRDGVEHVRKARLRRWQAVDPRERRT